MFDILPTVKPIPAWRNERNTLMTRKEKHEKLDTVVELRKGGNDRED